MKTLFISDLHLDPKRPDIQACFDQFINSCLNSNTPSSPNDEASIDSLYILGDLFEFWIGDDASIPIYQNPIAQLKQLADIGIPIYIMHGNRDFLMGSQFEQVTGCQLIPDLYHLEINNNEGSQTILLSHGDIFCSDDQEYMKFRQMVRDPLWQNEFLSKSIEERFNIAHLMREKSKQRGQQLHAQEKVSEIIDVNQKRVEEIISKHGVRTLIHGHTHRPATHEFQLNGQTIKRIVLPDWQPDAKVFEINNV
ncbi:MAG: UDP-2,3-diacylglucosamine diphosphatase [Gammaproteobacteria bacterium]|nr:UDP-2,3-diacylglucosamine diphosphatase [Gammaproteobacteria bacterium]